MQFTIENYGIYKLDYFILHYKQSKGSGDGDMKFGKLVEKRKKSIKLFKIICSLQSKSFLVNNVKEDVDRQETNTTRFDCCFKFIIQVSFLPLTALLASISSTFDFQHLLATTLSIYHTVLANVIISRPQYARRHCFEFTRIKYQQITSAPVGIEQVYHDFCKLSSRSERFGNLTRMISKPL